LYAPKYTVPRPGITTAPRGIGPAGASSWNPEHRTVDKPPSQRGETILALLVGLLLGRTDFGAAISGGRRGDVAGRLNRERIHDEGAEIVGGRHLLPPPVRRRIEQKAIGGA
jgi:hypothetical protein